MVTRRSLFSENVSGVDRLRDNVSGPTLRAGENRAWEVRVGVRARTSVPPLYCFFPARPAVPSAQDVRAVPMHGHGTGLETIILPPARSSSFGTRASRPKSTGRWTVSLRQRSLCTTNRSASQGLGAPEKIVFATIRGVKFKCRRTHLPAVFARKVVLDRIF